MYWNCRGPRGERHDLVKIDLTAAERKKALSSILHTMSVPVCPDCGRPMALREPNFLSGGVL